MHTREAPDFLGLHKNMNCAFPLSKSNDIIETLSIEVINQKKKTLLLEVYASHLMVMESNLKEHENLRKKDLVSSKQLFIIGDMNINSRDYETNSIVENFLILPLRMEYSKL